MTTEKLDMLQMVIGPHEGGVRIRPVTELLWQPGTWARHVAHTLLGVVEKIEAMTQLAEGPEA